MSNSLAKKFDKIVSKLGNKHKDTKLNGNETIDSQSNPDDATPDGNGEVQHESLLQRMKGHLGHTHGSTKNEQSLQTEGAPPVQVITDDLKDSPFKGNKKTNSVLSIYIYIRVVLNMMNRQLDLLTTCNSMHTSIIDAVLHLNIFLLILIFLYVRISCHVLPIKMSLTCRD
jgi:hypothetical protein